MPREPKYAHVSVDRIQALHAQGLTNRKIAEALGCPHWYIGRVVIAAGLVANGRRRGERIVDGDRQKCSRCGEWDLIKNFPSGRTGERAYKLTFCFRCKAKVDNARRSESVEAYFAEKFLRTRQRAKSLGVPFDLTKDFLLDRWIEQRGHCFYTDVTLVCAAGQGYHKHSCSVDRINFDGGYTVDNCVLITDRANTMKSDATLAEMAAWMPEWHRRAASHLRQLETDNQTRRIA
ncbi:HNH endonuclease [Gordonia phage SpeedDemon]|nr:HNH endonuclease [Gordonia phage SpeedDemon]